MNRLNKPKIRRFVPSFALQTTLFCFLANIAMGQTTELRNLTHSEFTKKINSLAQEGFRPIKIWSKQLGTIDSVGANFGFWATLKKDPNGPPWHTVHGINADQYQQSFNKWTGQGYIPTDVNVACVGSKVLYCAIFEQIPNAPAVAARHNINNATFQKENATWTRQGYKLKVKSSCRGVFAAIWQK